jgi:hypothetical protein
MASWWNITQPDLARGHSHATKTSETVLDLFSAPRSGEPHRWGEQRSTFLLVIIIDSLHSTYYIMATAICPLIAMAIKKSQSSFY